MLLAPASFELEDPERLWSYCGQDCAVTAGVAEALLADMTPQAAAIYRFQMACLVTATTMMTRGMLVDMGAVSDELRDIRRDCRELQNQLPPILLKSAVRGVGAAPSPTDISTYLYRSRKLQPMKNRGGQISTDRECLQRLRVKYPEIEELIDAIITLRELDKDRQTLERGIDADRRMRGGWSVGATETGRWSCSENPMGSGGNLQNIRHRLRRIFVPDPGYVMVYADLAQAESRTVAYLSGDEAYISSHLAGDTHINVARLLWPHLSWCGEDKADRRLADRPADFSPNHSWRDWAKREQHAYNYMQTHVGAARTLHIPQGIARQHQGTYFRAFGGIPAWHGWVSETVRHQERMTTPLGRERQFLGRTWEKATWREAVAYVPQSHVADIINLGGLRIWAAMEPHYAQLLANGHDAWLFQVIAGPGANDHAEEAVDLMTIPTKITDCKGETRTMTIPADYKIGENWAEIS